MAATQFLHGVRLCNESSRCPALPPPPANLGGKGTSGDSREAMSFASSGPLPPPGAGSAALPRVFLLLSSTRRQAGREPLLSWLKSVTLSGRLVYPVERHHFFFFN